MDAAIRHSNAVLAHLDDQFNNADTSDVTVVVETQKYHLHKVILSQSSVLKVMMYRPQWQECHSGVIELNEQPECLPVVKDFFQFFYSGSIKITDVILEPLVYLADKYCLSVLVNICCEYMRKNIYAKGELAFGIKCWKILQKVQNEEVEVYAKNFIAWNMDMVLKENLFMEFETSEWVALLGCPFLVVANEVCLYTAVTSWCDQEEEFLKLLPLIKFPMMRLDELVSVERLNLFPGVDKKTLTAEAYKFHALDFPQRHLVSFSDACVPRLYKNEPWDEQRSPVIGIKSSFCLTFRLNNLEMLSQWTKISQLFRLPMSLSQSDVLRFTQWEVTLMRTIKMLGMGMKTCGGLCLEIKKTGGETHPLFQAANVFIYEKFASKPVIRQVRTVTFDLAAQSQSQMISDLLPYDDIVGKTSTYTFEQADTVCHLAVDIILVEQSQNPT